MLVKVAYATEGRYIKISELFIYSFIYLFTYLFISCEMVILKIALRVIWMK